MRSPDIYFTAQPILSTAAVSFPSYLGIQPDELEPYTRAGWDGDDAAAVAAQAIDSAQAFLRGLPIGTIRPDLSVGHDGSLGLTWTLPDMTMFVHFSPLGIGDFTFDLSRHCVQYTKQFYSYDVDTLEYIRPILDYIRPTPVVFLIAVTSDLQTVITSEEYLIEQPTLRLEQQRFDITPSRPMLNAGDD
jgi:hypothetical protein